METEQQQFNGQPVMNMGNTEFLNGAEVVKKKSKKGIFIGIAAALAVVVGGSAAAYNFSPWVKNNVKMLVNDDAEYFAWVMEENGKTAANQLADAYQSYLDSIGKEAGFKINAELNSDELQKIIDSEAGATVGIKIPEEITIQTGAKNSKDGVASTGGELIIGKDTILDLNMYVKDSVVYYQIPDLSTSYVALDMNTMMEEAYAETDAATADIMRAYMDTAMGFKDASDIEELLSADDIKTLITTYNNAIFENLDDVEIEKGVEKDASGVEGKFNVATVTIDEKTAIKSLENVLKEAKSDDIIIDMCEKFGVDKDTYKDTIESALSSLKDAESGDKEVELLYYIDSKGVARGVETTFTGEDDVELFYLVAQDGGEYGMEFSFMAGENEGITLNVSGEEKSGKISGDASLALLDGEKIEIPVSFNDVEVVGDDEYIKGDFEVDLTGLGVDEFSKLAFELDSDGKSQTIKTDVEIEGTKYGTFAITMGEEAYAEAPKFDESLTVYQFTEDGSGLEGYIEEVNANLVTFLNNVGNAFGFEGLGDMLGEEADLNSLIGGSDDYYVEDDYYDDYDDYDYDDYDDYDYDDSDDYEEDLDDYSTEEVYYDFSKLDISLNGTAVTLPSKIDGILSYVDVTDEVLDGSYGYGYYTDAGYTTTVSVTNESGQELAPADCPVTGISVYEGSPLDLKLNGIGIGSSVTDAAAEFGFTVDDPSFGYTMIYNEETYDSIYIYWSDGEVYSLSISLY